MRNYKKVGTTNRPRLCIIPSPIVLFALISVHFGVFNLVGGSNAVGKMYFVLQKLANAGEPSIPRNLVDANDRKVSIVPGLYKQVSLLYLY